MIYEINLTHTLVIEVR